MNENFDLYCHSCEKNFIAKINSGVDGNHIINCPHCDHEHCRVIYNGVVTSERWDGRNETTIKVEKRNIVKLQKDIGIAISNSHFLREKWINKI